MDKDDPTDRQGKSISRGPMGAGLAIGFGAGGFFDGILLHQILQWHHLLSGLQAQAGTDLRFQVLADGLFHALMYVITGLGFWLLWRRRQDLAEPGSGRVLVAAALAGFGAWHVIDSVLSHWVLGIHRIRMDVDDPLVWDLVWFFAFGVLFLVFAWVVGRGARRGGNGRAAAMILVPATLLLGGLAALPQSNGSAALVLFSPQTSPAEGFSLVQASGARLLWADPPKGLWIVDARQANPFHLLRAGAIWLGAPVLPAGCLDWTDFTA